MSLLAAKMGDRLFDAKASNSGVANSFVSSTTGASGLALFDTDNDSRILDQMGYVHTGTRQGDYVRLDSYTAATFTITPAPNFGGNIGTTTELIGISRYSPRDYEEAIESAQRYLNFDRALGIGIMKELDGREIQLGNALLNPVFDLYTTANVPNSWSSSNLTVTQETTITYGGCRRSLKVVTDGVNVANLNQSLTEVARYKGLTYTAYAIVFCETASEVFLRVNDGVDNHNSSLHTGKGWETLSVSVTVDDKVDAMTASVRTTTAGSTITFYVQNVWIPKAPPTDHFYTLNASINAVVLDGGMSLSSKSFQYRQGSSAFGDFGANDFDILVSPSAWQIALTTTRGIVLSLNNSYNGHVLKYTGWKNHAELSTVATDWAGPIDAILDMAAAILHASKTAPSAQPNIQQAVTPTVFGDIAAVRAGVLRRWGVRPASGWKLVEPIE